MNIELSGLSFRYPSGVLALDQVDLRIPSGQLVAILGENGAGKTTLVKMLNGLLRPSQGQVRIGEWDAAEHTTAQLASRVGFLFQNPDDQLFERDVAREVAYGPRNLGQAERGGMGQQRQLMIGYHRAAFPHALAAFRLALKKNFLGLSITTQAVLAAKAAGAPQDIELRRIAIECGGLIRMAQGRIGMSIRFKPAAHALGHFLGLLLGQEKLHLVGGQCRT